MNKILNKIPALDNGFVALFSCSHSHENIIEIKRDYFNNEFNEELLKYINISMIIKCPLFVQLMLSSSDLYIKVKKHSGKLETYIPDVSEIKAKSLEISKDIQYSIEQTSEALKINPDAYQTDGCDMFISQINSPISIYTTLYLSGNLYNWLEVINKKDLPAPIESYRKIINDLVNAEITDMWRLTGEKKKGKRE